MAVSHDIIAKPAVLFNIAKGEGDKTNDQNALIVPTDELKGKFPKKGKQKQGFDDKIVELEVDAETENTKRKGTGWPINQATANKIAGKAQAETKKDWSKYKRS